MPPTAPPPLSGADYQAIEAAVMETARGRWFLAEYARRNRHADTEMLLNALERLETVIRNETAGPVAERLRGGLMGMAEAISQTKAEIAAIKPDASQGRIEEATEELDSVVHATETATSDILAAAERIQEIAWTLREQGLEPQACDLLDAQATDIYTACSFQDVTGQRTRKVIGVLRFLESRVAAMIEIWGIEPSRPASAPNGGQEGAAALLNGPAKGGLGLDQADVDLVMGPAAGAGVSAASRAAATDGCDDDTVTAPNEADSGPHQADAAREPDEDLVEYEGVPLQAPPAPLPGDPLAAIRALSYEEKIALFT
jgi:chemotaxis protein CheZ